MGLESFNYIPDLNPLFPVGATDTKSQGDDHLRGIKGTLQKNFPDANTAFYLPKSLATTGNATINASHNNGTLLCDASGGHILLSLTAAGVLGSRFFLTVIKVDPGPNGVTIAPATAETIDGLASISITQQFQSRQLVCTAFQWFTHGGTAPPPATPTQQLQGVSTIVAATPDSVAALWEKGATIPSAATVNLTDGGFFHITGTNPITAINFSTPKDGRTAWVIFDGALTLTHNAVSLKLPGGANIVTSAGDRACFVQDSAGNTICLSYERASGSSGQSSVTISDVAPNSPFQGDLWWESDTGKLYVRYNDGNSIQWVGIFV